MEGGPLGHHPSVGSGGGGDSTFLPLGDGGGLLAPSRARVSTGSRMMSEKERRKTVKVPQDGTFIKIKSVFDIYKQVRMTVGMVSNVWSWQSHTTTLFRQAMPGLANVYVGKEVFTVPGFLLMELDTVSVRRPNSKGMSPSKKQVTDPLVETVYIDHPTSYFKHIILLLKLRWLLRLHSACCELDYKMCSIKNLILGLQYVVLQQHEEVECDNVFETKVSQHIGSHMNLESLIDDIVDQLQRALGAGWKGFLEYVASCDPARSVHYSRMDYQISTPPIHSNDTLAIVLDTIFVASFLRLPRGAARLCKLYEDLEALNIRLPEVPPLADVQYLTSWAKAKSKPTLQDRVKCSKKDAEKLAQMDAVLLTASVELHTAEVIGGPDEATEELANLDVSAAYPDAAPIITAADLGVTGKAAAEGGPPAARVILQDKPRIAQTYFDAALSCIHHHHTFPDGLRERLYGLLTEEYGLTAAQMQKLAIGSTQNIDGNRLPESTLLGMEEREKVRLRNHQATTGSITTHLLQPPIVSPPREKGKPPKHILPGKTQSRSLFGSSFSSADMSRSLPDLRGFSVRKGSQAGRENFKVPMITGPLTRDPDLGHLRTTGFFIKMPPLRGEA